MKKCFKCGINKQLTDFYKHPQMPDGRVNKCKECNKKDVRKNYRENINHYKSYEQVRNQKRKKYISDKNKKYQKENPEKMLLYKKKWLENNKSKRAAHYLLSNAKRDGRINVGLCQICKSREVEAHHYDYTKPLNVIWLCKEHHEEVHWWLRWNKRKYSI